MNARQWPTMASSDRPAARTPPDAAEPMVGNYFVSTYPPFSCWKSDHVDEVQRVLDAPRDINAEAPLGLYVHVPFCAERCDYCYYRSYAQPTHWQTDRYIAALLAELAIYGASPAVAGRPLDFAYFGGGTPSLLTARQIQRLLDGVHSIFSLSGAREVTFECAPQTATVDRLAVLRDAGVTRISVGVQQLDDKVLAKSGRIHRVDQVRRAYAQIKPFGFAVVNLDLMVGLVGETDDSFFTSLDRIIEMRPMSVTIYLLEIPPNTPLFQALRDHATGDRPLDNPPASWDVKRGRLARAFERLEQHGYTVRSAYAAVRDAKLGRFIYQEAQYHGADLLGAGVSSFSYLGGAHYQNHASLEAYLESLSRGQLPHARACLLSEEERMVREFILQLKLGSAGAKYFRDRFGVCLEQRFETPLTEFAERGYLRVDRDAVTLTRDGLLRVDRLIPAFYLPQHRGKTYW